MCPKIKNHNVNRLVSLLVFISLTSFTSAFAGSAGQGTKVHTIVIDPGHGGMDPGAIGPGGHHESDLALAVSLKFGDMVHQAFPDVRIIYTRTTDKFVSLADRADMANKAKADLFICIHLNSATNHDAYGTATYVLGLHRTDDNLEVAKRENSVIELEGDKDKNYEFDPNSPEGHIIMSMKQNAFLDQSILIASKIEDELAVLSKRKSHGVKQAGFWVLYKTAMPSLLAEVGFISNPTEEQYLATDMGQTNIATSIYKAFRSYKFEIEGIKDTAIQAPAPASVVQAAVEKKTEIFMPDTLLIVQKAVPPVASSQPRDQPGSPAPAPEKQQPVSINKTEQKKEAKAWQPDTIASVKTPAVKPAVHVDTAMTEFKPIDQVATLDTQSVIQNGRIAIAPESTTPKTDKKVPLRTNYDDVATPVAKAPDTIKNIARQPLTVAADTPLMAKVVPVVKPAAKPAAGAAKPETKTIATASITTPAPAIKSTATPKVVSPPKPVVTAPIAKAEPQHVAPKTATGSDVVYFTVQLLAAKHKPANYDDLVNTFGLMDREDIGDGVTRYMAGEFAQFRDAKNALQVAHDKGVKDAFIVGYLNGKRQDGKATHTLSLRYP
jgi:N-acetylmuramoyl-L-alanine amidase